jgi:hypothetical protein
MSQPNEIAITVDEANDGSTTADVVHTYERYLDYENRAVYKHDTNHTLSSRDTLSLLRTFPKANGNFRGQAKSTAKFTKDVIVTGLDGENIVAPVIVSLEFSVPVGLSSSEMLLARQKMVALADLDSVMDELNLNLMI